jgi:hypothetical protein
VLWRLPFEIEFVDADDSAPTRHPRGSGVSRGKSREHIEISRE